MARNWLIAAGLLDIGAALLHLWCLVGGADWYRALGAGEKIARMVERGRITPHLMTVGIAGIVLLWAFYAFSGAGLLPRLPLLRLGLVAICAVLALRSLAPLAPALLPGRTPGFILWSSAVVAVFAAVHIVGTWLNWQRTAG